MRARGTAVVFRNGKVLLVRDRGKHRFSLPGGGTQPNEPSMGAAVRELFEELGMSARKAERVFECDFEGSLSKHKVSLIETDDEPRLRGKELDKFIWWDMKTDVPRYAHVDQILKKLR
jgi:8-oxo-dGTP pyrophosphatase MutT (NUDIX family)